MGKSDLSNFYIALRASCGISYPVNCFTSIYIGPEVIISLNSVLKAKEFTDAFGSTSAAKNVVISKYGLKFGLTYKF